MRYSCPNQSLLIPSACSGARPPNMTVTEEYRVPDGMVGLSEYTHRVQTAHTFLWPHVLAHDITCKWCFNHVWVHAHCLKPRPNQFLVVFSSVIGRGGEQINKIQQDSGCKVQIAPGELCGESTLKLFLVWVIYAPATMVNSISLYVVVRNYI